MGMDCRKIEQMIYPYIDGELTHDEAETVRIHLSTCAGCGNKFQSWQHISSALHDLGETTVSAPPAFTVAVMQRIADGEKAAALPQKNSWLSRKWKQTTVAVAVAVMLIVGTLTTYSGSLLQMVDNFPSVIQPGSTSTDDINTPASTNNAPGATDVTPDNKAPADTTPSQSEQPDPSGTTPRHRMIPGIGRWLPKLRISSHCRLGYY